MKRKTQRIDRAKTPAADSEEQTDEPTDVEDEDQDGDRDDKAGWVPDFLKRTVVAGLGNLLTSEEGIKKLATEFSLPKDLASSLLNQAQGTKDELFRVVGQEIREFLEGLNISEELARMLTMLSFEIKTEVRFIPNEKKMPKPNIKSRWAIRRRKRDEDTPDPESTEE